MPRLPTLHGLLRRQPRPRRRPAPPASALRRERRALMRLREQKLRDLGGLSLEMYRRDRFREDLLLERCAELIGLEARISFREDLLLERCAELIGLEARIHELDVLLGAADRAPGVPKTARCECGAPLLWGSRFCASCGRPVTETAANAR